MASPGNRFGAHEGGGPIHCQFDELAQSFGKIRRLHVVGKATEGGIAPACIGRIHARMPQTPQGLHVSVVDPPVAEKSAERYAIELGIVPGTGNAPYIHQSLDAISFQQLHKFIQGPRRMAHSEDDWDGFYGLLFRFYTSLQGFSPKGKSWTMGAWGSVLLFHFRACGLAGTIIIRFTASLTNAVHNLFPTLTGLATTDFAHLLVPP